MSEYYPLVLALNATLTVLLVMQVMSLRHKASMLHSALRKQSAVNAAVAETFRALESVIKEMDNERNQR